MILKLSSAFHCLVTSLDRASFSFTFIGMPCYQEAVGSQMKFGNRELERISNHVSDQLRINKLRDYNGLSKEVRSMCYERLTVTLSYAKQERRNHMIISFASHWLHPRIKPLSVSLSVICVAKLPQFDLEYNGKGFIIITERRMDITSPRDQYTSTPIGQTENIQHSIYIAPFFGAVTATQTLSCVERIKIMWFYAELSIGWILNRAGLIGLSSCYKLLFVRAHLSWLGYSFMTNRSSESRDQYPRLSLAVMQGARIIDCVVNWGIEKENNIIKSDRCLHDWPHRQTIGSSAAIGPIFKWDHGIGSFSHVIHRPNSHLSLTLSLNAASLKYHSLDHVLFERLPNLNLEFFTHFAWLCDMIFPLKLMPVFHVRLVDVSTFTFTIDNVNHD